MKLPAFFRPIMWSWDMEAVNPKTMMQTIIMQALNYGDLVHWRWICDTYGTDAVQAIFHKNKETNMDAKNAQLVQLLLG